MNGPIGQPVSRVDGAAKVGGEARYAADFAPRDLAYGVIVPATVAKGRIVAIDSSAAEAMPGVLSVISHLNAPHLAYSPMEQRPLVDPKSGDQLRVFQGAEILFNGQPVAVVVAEERELAVAAAQLVHVDYAVEPASTDFAQAAQNAQPPRESALGGRPAHQSRGDADGQYGRAAVRIDATYTQPAEFHNAIELHGTIALWQHDRLTLWDKTQWVDNDAAEIAHVFGIPDENVRVISPFVGGAFGSALRTWPHVVVAAVAAWEVHRPVEVVLTRRQQFASTGYRPLTVQRIRLGAGSDGRLASVIQDVTAQTSTYEEFVEMVGDPPTMLYSTPSMRTDHRLAALNVNSPCPMRAPGIVTGVLALEMAMDELAEACHLDPVLLRVRNYAERDEHKDLPWSSKSLRQCYELGAQRIDWSRRNAKPGAVRDGRWLVGFGMASAVYPTHRAPAAARAELRTDGTVVVSSASSDMGPGTYTSMCQVAAEELDLPVTAVRFELGDTTLPRAPVHGGSITMASVGTAVQAASRNLRAKLRELDRGLPNEPGGMRQRYADLLREHRLDVVVAEGASAPGDEAERFSMYAFGALFAEVRVDPELGEIRVPRLVGAYGAGRIVNPKIARSQCIGGMVGGLGMALTEQAMWDPRFGKVMNANLAEYLVPVNADVASLDAVFVDEADPHVNPLGVKGLAEIALVGVAPAIANAVYNATGRRIRSLPLSPEAVLAS